MRKEFFTEGADTGLTSLGALEPLVERVLQIDHIDLRGGLRRDIHYPEAALMSEFSRRQDRVEVVLITLLLVLPRLLELVHRRLLLSFRLLVGDAGGDEHGLIILHQRLGRLLRHLRFSNRFFSIINSITPFNNFSLLSSLFKLILRGFGVLGF